MLNPKEPASVRTTYMRRHGRELLDERIARLSEIHATGNAPLLLLVEETLSILAALRMMNPNVVADCEQRAALEAFKAVRGVCVECENRAVANNLCASCAVSPP